MSSRLADPEFLVAYVPTNNHVEDLIRGNNGVWSGDERYEDGPQGRQAGSFDGTGDYITLPAGAESLLRFNGATDSFSVAMWVKKNATGVAYIALDKRDVASAGWNLQLSSTDKIKVLIGSTTVTSGTILVAGRWYHVVYVLERVSSAGGQIYLDGEPDVASPVDVSGITFETTAAPIIGSRSFTIPAFEMDGGMAEIRVYNIALTALEVQELFRRPVPRG